MKTIGQKISELRKQKQMTQEELAEVLNVTSQAVSKWENDQSIPDMNTLIQISDYFSISLDRLIREEKEVYYSISEAKQKDIEDMQLMVVVHSKNKGDVKVKFPLKWVAFLSKNGMKLGKLLKNDGMNNIDIDFIITMVESGSLGKIIEVETEKGEVIEIIVE